MIIFPAIDIKEGKVVRLAQGRFDHMTQYACDPMEAALHWKSLGAEWLHIVDLDGARSGVMHNIDIIKKIAREIGIPVQVGGGIRSNEVIDDLLSNRVSRVVLGTKAIEDQDFLQKALRAWSASIVVSVDCVKGYVMKNGWEKTASFSAQEFVKHLELYGLKCLIYTDVAKDGMLAGPNLKMIEGILEFTKYSKIHLIASGGISSIQDLQDLCAISRTYENRLIGAIAGKSLYEGKMDFKQALEICSTNA